MIELMFLMELILIRLVNQKTSHYCYFLDNGLKFQADVSNKCHDVLMMPMNLTDVYNKCHDVLMMPMNLSDIAILNIHSADYHYIISE